MHPFRTASIFTLSATALWAEVKSDIPLGIEAVTGYRSDYLRNGISAADGVLDFQLESEITLTNDSFLSIGAWHAVESGGDFNETAFSLQLTRQWQNIRLTGELSYYDFDSSVLESGIDSSLQLSYDFSRDLSLSGFLGFDTGADSSYGRIELNYSRPLGENAFGSTRLGLFLADDYYGRSGLTEAYARASLTYNINSQLSLTPFIGLSEAPDEDFTLYTGIWLAISF